MKEVKKKKMAFFFFLLRIRVFSLSLCICYVTLNRLSFGKKKKLLFYKSLGLWKEAGLNLLTFVWLRVQYYKKYNVYLRYIHRWALSSKVEYSKVCVVASFVA
jgi:hypothetical protein